MIELHGCIFYNRFCKVCKKNQTKIETLATHNSQVARTHFMIYPNWQTAIMQKLWALEKGPWNYIFRCVNHVFFFLSIYTHSVMCWPSWLHDTQLCVLILNVLWFPQVVHGQMCIWCHINLMSDADQCI